MSSTAPPGGRLCPCTAGGTWPPNRSSAQHTIRLDGARAAWAAAAASLRACAQLHINALRGAPVLDKHDLPADRTYLGAREQEAGRLDARRAPVELCHVNLLLRRRSVQLCAPALARAPQAIFGAARAPSAGAHTSGGACAGFFGGAGLRARGVRRPLCTARLSSDDGPFRRS